MLLPLTFSCQVTKSWMEIRLPLIVHEDASQLQVATAMSPEFSCYYETGQQVV